MASNGEFTLEQLENMLAGTGGDMFDAQWQVQQRYNQQLAQQQLQNQLLEQRQAMLSRQHYLLQQQARNASLYQPIADQYTGLAGVDSLGLFSQLPAGVGYGTPPAAFAAPIPGLASNFSLKSQLSIPDPVSPSLTLGLDSLALKSPAVKTETASHPVPNTTPSVVPPPPASLGDVTVVPDLVLITSQPSPFGRFRYKSEQRERPLEGEKGYPEITINPKYASEIPAGTCATVRLVTKTVNAQGEPQPHFHELGGTLEVPLQGADKRAMYVIFDNLTVLMTKHNDERAPKNRHKDDQRAVRLMFEVVFQVNGRTHYGSAVSQAIFNAKLTINKLSVLYGPCTGGNELIILCSKVRKGTTTVVLSDAQVTDGSAARSANVDVVKGDTPQWQIDPVSRLGICVMPIRCLSFHHQYAIVVDMPPYHTLSIDEPTRINVQITDFEDCTESQPIHYSYLPALELTQARLTESKKRRMDDGLKDFWSQFGDAQPLV